jgi:hypothetical protein
MYHLLVISLFQLYSCNVYVMNLNVYLSQSRSAPLDTARLSLSSTLGRMFRADNSQV